MNAWHSIIMLHLYGTLLFRHADMPKILADGLSCGANTLFIFGWWREGMDAGYPDYHYDEEQGGFDALKKHIADFKSKGGRVILYFNGQLIDTASEYYRTHGKKVTVKLPGGLTEHQEFYKFGGAGTALRVFGNRTFVTACPASHEWREILKKFVDRAFDLNCDGVFFDQLGGVSYPCCDTAHNHDVPFMNIGNAKRELVKELYEYTKSRSGEMAFGIESICDITGEYTDFIHNISGSWKCADEELHRFTCPEYKFCDRCILDDSDIMKRVNWAFRLGLRSDIEIFRCRATIAAAPDYKKSLSLINSWRSKYASYLFNGVFKDTEGAHVDASNVSYSVFEKDGGTLVVITAGADTKSTAFK